MLYRLSYDPNIAGILEKNILHQESFLCDQSYPVIYCKIHYFDRRSGFYALRLLRKEVIQPQVPLRLPCYDFVPITSLTLGRRLL